MKIIPDKAIINSEEKKSPHIIIPDINSSDPELEYSCPDCHAYPPFINSHDHLIGNWIPKAGNNAPYQTTDIWVEEMKNSESVLERNRIWFNDGTFDLMDGNVRLLAQLGIYKNIFSGCTVVQDHAPNQKSEYYNQFPILVTPDYRQCHSISLGNWWGGRSASEEWQSTKGKIPFILHLAEGVNDSARSAFGKFEAAGLLQPNTLIIHGIALTRAEIRKCAAAGTSICCCPESNFFLIGKTIDVQACLEFGVNLVIGTDSTMSGSTNMLTELKIFHEHFPEIPMKQVFRFVTVNAGKALMLPKKFGVLSEKTTELLLLDKLDEDPYENLLHCSMNEIRLLLHEGKPIYGDVEVLEYFKYNADEYEIFRIGNREKFVIGHPQQVNRDIDNLLGYHKDFPYLPF